MKSTIHTHIRRILVPCDFKADSQSALKYTAFLAKKDQAQPELCRGIFRKLRNRFLDDSGSHFAEGIADHAEIDMICILYFANEKMIHAFGIDAEQKVITNKAGIPVLVLNPIVANLHNTRSLIGQWDKITRNKMKQKKLSRTAFFMRKRGDSNPR